MKWPVVCATLLLTAAGTSALGDPLAGSSLPQDTKWVIHLDVDGARTAAPLWNLARLKIYEPRRAELQPKLGVLERLTGLKLPQDLHDVTLFGTSFDEASACFRIHGVMDKTTVVNFLRNDPEFQQVDYNGHDILRWRDKGRDRLMFAGFGAGDMAVLSANSKAVELALDVLDAKSPALKLGSPLTPPVVPSTRTAPQPLFWMAAESLSELPQAQPVESPVLSQIDAASLGVTWANDRASAELRVAARSEKAAQQLQAVAEGVKAFVALSAAEEHAPPRLRLLSGALQQLTVQADGKALKGEWSMEIGKLESMVNVLMQEQAATTPPPLPLAPPPTPATSRQLP